MRAAPLALLALIAMLTTTALYWTRYEVQTMGPAFIVVHDRLTGHMCVYARSIAAPESCRDNPVPPASPTQPKLF
jgi:hypothetical protein